MTELETLERAKMYLDKLASGVDPLTDRPAAEGDVIRQARVSRCLSYVSDVLRQLIERVGVPKPKKRVGGAPFALTPAEAARFDYSDVPIPVGELTQRVNACLTDENTQRLRNGVISAFLEEAGFLASETDADGRARRLATEAGERIGIYSETRTGYRGPYTVTLYTRDAQVFVLDHIDAIAAHNARPSRRAGAEPEGGAQP